MRQIKVLVLDDSMVFRESISQEVTRNAGITVVAKCASSSEADIKIIDTDPDILIVGMAAVKYDSQEFVRRAVSKLSKPVIAVSTDPSLKAAAEVSGARAFLVRPDGQLVNTNTFYSDLIVQIRSVVSGESIKFTPQQLNNGLIVIGASTGGAEALEIVLNSLPAVMPPIVIAQHMPAKFTSSFAARLNLECPLSVMEAKNGDVAMPGQAYIAPGGFHTTVHKRDLRYVLTCSENLSGLKICPCVDYLFSSAAALGGKNIIGVILTGMGRDGAEGLMQLRESGAVTIGQDQATSVVYGMPKVAFEIGAVKYLLPLNKIAQKLVELSAGA